MIFIPYLKSFENKNKQINKQRKKKLWLNYSLIFIPLKSLNLNNILNESYAVYNTITDIIKENLKGDNIINDNGIELI